MFDKELIDLFKVLVVSENQKAGKIVADNLDKGYVTDFIPSKEHQKGLNAYFKPLDVVTLFTVEERKNSNPIALITKQLLHYVEVYGLNTPGLFNLEVKTGKVAVLGFVRGVTKDELTKLVQDMIYANAPIAKVKELSDIIKYYQVDYDLNKIANNEVRIRLYQDKDTFASGDDAVRYIVLTATNDTMLIKSGKVVAAVKANAKLVSTKFLEQHVFPLARVFNRHKKLIMSLKNDQNKSVINKISRLSKSHHVPIREAINKTFIAKYMNDEISDVAEVLKKLSVRDKFKYLNLIEYKLLQNQMDAFIIRNGKVYLEKNRKLYSHNDLIALQKEVVESLKEDLKHLKGKSILLDKNVNYGIPISQKQCVGNLPFGTEVSIEGNEISSGIYWENQWGARDLDLSAIDETGYRTGWGGWGGYSTNNPLTFSGDVTDATNGAMEFITSNKKHNKVYGLFTNVFCGETNCEMELVIGEKTDKKWIKNPVIREKTKLRSKENILGFVRDGKFVVYYCQPSNHRMTGSDINKTLISKGLAPVWNIRKLLDTFSIAYDEVPEEGKEYDYDLTYSGFSLDKLEGMVYNR